MSEEEVHTGETPQGEPAQEQTAQADTPPQQDQPRTQEFSMTGEQVVEFLKKLLHEGNIRRVVLKDESGKTLLEIPVTIGVVGVVLLPVWAAIGAAAALVAKMTIVIERTE